MEENSEYLSGTVGLYLYKGILKIKVAKNIVITSVAPAHLEFANKNCFEVAILILSCAVEIFWSTISFLVGLTVDRVEIASLGTAVLQGMISPRGFNMRPFCLKKFFESFLGTYLQ